MTSDPRFLGTLARLNEIGSAINRLGAGDLSNVRETLYLIVESACEVVPGSSAVIYTYDETTGSFDPGSRVSVEQDGASQPDFPRKDGFGMRAVSERRRVLSSEEPDLEIHPAKSAIGAKAMACFPLVVAGEVLGALYIYLLERRYFAEVELLMLDNFVNLTGMTLSLARQLQIAEKEQARKERELRRLRRAGMLISSRSSLKGTLEIILQMALEVIDAQYGIFRLVDGEGKNLVTHAIAGDHLGKPAVETLPIDGNSIMGLAATRRESLNIPDLSIEPWKGIYYPLDRELVMRSELAVPLIGASGRLEGVINLESPQVNAFSKQDRYILQILATQAVIAIQEIRLLDALQQISDLLLIQPLQSFHQTLVERACDLLNVPASLIWLVEEKNLVVQAASDVEFLGRRVCINESFTGQAVNSRVPISCFEGYGDIWNDRADLDFLSSSGSALAMPLLAGEDQHSIGAFSIYSPHSIPGDFDQSEWYKKVLNILGYYAVLAIQYRNHQVTLGAIQEQKALAETFAAVGDLSMNLLHSLNNKIGTIPVRVEGLRDKSQAAIEADPYLKMNLAEIERSASEAMEIVHESLFHLHPIQLLPVQISECIHEAIATIKVPAGIEIQTFGLERLPPVQAGRKRLAFVFANLIENAIDALGDRGLIRIEGSSCDGCVEIKVIDNGPGIDPTLHERIFEFTYSTRSSERPGKLGFGLWWVKTLMVRFGGSVSVQSDGRNGTTFCLRFPSGEEK
jgi:signal transduction histidine kinase/GAF domain-containing protein